METFLIILVVVILATFALVKMGVVRFKLSLQDGFSFEVGAKPSTIISLGNYLGVVISTDGESRKLHLNFVVSTNTSSVIENIKLTLDDQTFFRIKQFYSEDPQRLLRSPNSTIHLPITLHGETIRLYAEFETYESSTFDLTKGHHKIFIEFKADKKTIKKKHTIDIQENTIRAINFSKESARETRRVVATSDRFGRVSVIEVPIILE